MIFMRPAFVQMASFLVSLTSTPACGSAGSELMSFSYDIAIIGAGAAGSSAAYHLSKTGNKILVIDRFNPPHGFGSSHGQSRIIREAYFESPVYVPLVQEAYELWYQLEKESNKKLLLKTGGLMLGAQDSKVV